MKKSMEKLVQLAQTGDEEAIAQLYEQTYNSVYQSVRAIIKDEDEALDIVQDSYIKGFQNLDKLGNPEKYQAWMKRLASNMALDYLRKKRPSLFSERIDEDGEEIDLRHQDDCLDHMPEEVIDRQETTRLMNDILGTLSEEQRLAIVMFYYEERSVREIAESLSCSENTVKSRLNYGRKKIEAEVLALEKRGTKLYSLAPMPFFIWVLRMAKVHGIAAETVAQTTAVGVAGAAAAAGETAAASAGGSVAGSTAAGAAAKTAGTAVGKTLATKIVAGTLAVTMTAGAGAAAIHNRNIEKENAAAHVIYEEMLDRYKTMAEMDFEECYREKTRFWDELLVSTLKKYPNEIHGTDISQEYLAQNAIHQYEFSSEQEWDYNRLFDFKWETDFEQGIPMPDTVYFPTMNPNLWIDEVYRPDGDDERFVRYSLYYAVADIDKNGIDDLFLWNKPDSSTGGRNKDGWVQIHTISDGYVHVGEIRIIPREDGSNTWEILRHGSGYWWDIDGVKYYFNIFSKESRFSGTRTYKEPELKWKQLLD